MLRPDKYNNRTECQIVMFLFIYLFIGRESKWTYMTDGLAKKCEINTMLKEYTFYIIYVLA